MSEKSTKSLNQLISIERLKEIDSWIAKYPDEERQSAVMSALRIVQEEHGSLTQELMAAVAEYLRMPEIAVYEVASFYTMYELEPVGRHLISVCTNVSCKLRNADELFAQLKEKLKLDQGHTTMDGRFTLRAVECLGACVNAPMMQIDKDYHEHLTTDKIDAILEQYP